MPKEDKGGATAVGLNALWLSNIREKRAFATDSQHKITCQWNLSTSLARLKYSYFAGTATKLRFTKIKNEIKSPSHVKTS